MINTYHTSHAPPPVPPRLNRSHQVLIPAPLPSPGYSKTLVRFLVGVVVLVVLLFAGGFIYLNYKEKMERSYSAGEKAELLSSDKQETYYNKALADMAVASTTVNESKSGYLQWDMNRSVRRNINYYRESWLTILQSGDYFVYSRVTFTKGSSVSPQMSRVFMRKSTKAEEKILMQAYCNPGSSTGNAHIPRLCTATQEKVIWLEEGNQLSVWTENLSLVDYDEKATDFGMYKL